MSVVIGNLGATNPAPPPSLYPRIRGVDLRRSPREMSPGEMLYEGSKGSAIGSIGGVAIGGVAIGGVGSTIGGVVVFSWASPCEAEGVEPPRESHRVSMTNPPPHLPCGVGAGLGVSATVAMAGEREWCGVCVCGWRAVG